MKPKKSLQKNTKSVAKTVASKSAVKISKRVVVKAEVIQAAPVRKQPSYDELILTHRDNGRKLARSMLRRWHVVMPLDEIDSLVDLTLCEAAKRYDIDKGASFITFLFYHLRGHLVRAVASATSDSQLVMAIAQSAGVDVSEWSTANEDTAVHILPELSMDRPDEAESPELLMMKREKSSLCQQAIVKLDDLEKEIIDRSYGQDEPLVDIARLLGYSRCHISRVKKRALDRIREYIGDASAEYLAEIAVGENEDDTIVEERAEPRRNRRRRIEIQGSKIAA